MACFIVPAAEAVVTTIAAKAVESKEKLTAEEVSQAKDHIRFSAKLKWLNKLLWGGSALLAFEHLWHGEIAPVFPFLTGSIREAFTEMATTGTVMAGAVTALWLGMVGVAHRIEKKSEEPEVSEES